MNEGTPYWKSGKLTGSVLNKIRAYLKQNLIKESDTPGIFFVFGIPGRSKTTHTVDMYAGTCTCQANKNGKGKICSHIRAVMLYIEQDRKSDGENFGGVK